MSVIVKQSVPAPQAKTVSAADLLAGATKKGKPSNHLIYVGEVGCEAATRWLDLNDKLAETERELALARDRVLDVIRPWHEDACAKRKAHEATVVVETPTGLRAGHAALPRSIIEGVVFKRRTSAYAKQRRASTETRDWLKRRFGWNSGRLM